MSSSAPCLVGALLWSSSKPRIAIETTDFTAQWIVLVFLVYRRACDGMVLFAALNLPTCHWLGCSRALKTS